VRSPSSTPSPPPVMAETQESLAHSPAPTVVTNTPAAAVSGPLRNATLLQQLTPDQLSMIAILKALNITGNQGTPRNVLTTPRFGGTTKLGVWTGLGFNDDGLVPRTHDCMRAYYRATIKEETTLAAVHDNCMKGLVTYKFCLTHERDAHKLIPCVKELHRAVRNGGMEGVFIIVKADGSTIDLFKHPALANEKMIKQWITDLTVNGVHDGHGGRLPVCEYDVFNLKLSGQAILNSCSEALHDLLIRTLKDPKTHSGPLIYHYIMKQIAEISNTHTRSLTEAITKINIRNIPGEDMNRYAEQVLLIVDEIYMTILDESLVPDLATLSLVGLNQASDEYLRTKAADAMILANQNVNEDGNSARLEPIDLLRPLQAIYKARYDLKCYGPALAVKALQTQVHKLEQSLEQDRSKIAKSSPSVKSERRCFECGSPDHMRPDCPKLRQSGGASISTLSSTGKSASQSVTSHDGNGLSSEESKKVTALIKSKLSTMPPIHEISESLIYDIRMGYHIVAKFCGKCR